MSIFVMLLSFLVRDEPVGCPAAVGVVEDSAEGDGGGVTTSGRKAQ